MEKLTQCDILVELFRWNDWKMTLGELLKHSVGYKCTSRFADLRKKGYVITCTKGKSPSQNVYTMIPPDSDGQLRLII